MRKRIFIMLCGLTLLLICLSTVYGKETQNYLVLAEDVYLPPASGKYPVVFLAHNEWNSKENWFDFPQALSEEGFVVVSLTWKSFFETYDINEAIHYTVLKYANVIDFSRMAFIGGSHGGVKFISLLNNKTIKNRTKAMVVLSISEVSESMEKTLQKEHPPILAIYGSKDRYEEAGMCKRFTDEMLTEPKKVIVLNAVPHGTELAVEESTEVQVRKEITIWLKKYLSNN